MSSRDASVFEGTKQIGGPAEIAFGEVAFGELLRSEPRKDALNQTLIFGRRCRCESQRDRAEPEFEQAISSTRLQVVFPLRERFGDKADLCVVQPKATIGFCLPLLERPRIWKKDSRRTGLCNC